MRPSRFRLFLAVAVPVAAIATGGVAAVTAQAAAAGCQVTYSVSSQWSGGFGVNVGVTNLGDPLTSWTLTWSFGAGQQITQAWNATVSQSGAQVTARNASWNGNLATNGSTSFGFNGSWNNSSNPAPTNFALNGVACNGASTPSPTRTTTTAPPTSTQGLSILLVEQDLRVAFALADEVTVIQRGAIVYRSTTQEFRGDAERAHRLLGVALI